MAHSFKRDKKTQVPQFMWDLVTSSFLTELYNYSREIERTTLVCQYRMLCEPAIVSQAWYFKSYFRAIQLNLNKRQSS